MEDYTWDVASTQDLGRTNSQSIKHRDDGLQHPGVLLPHLLADIREALLMHPIWDSHNALLESLLCKYQDLAVCPPIRTVRLHQSSLSGSITIMCHCVTSINTVFHSFVM